MTVVEDYKASSLPYSQVFPACLNACIALLNQTAICQKEAPCVALSIGINSRSQSFEVVNHEDCDSVIDVVCDSNCRILMLNTRKALPSSPDLPIFSPKFEQIVKRYSEQVIEVTFS